MGPFPGNERTWKPFNPILGETFELSMDNGLKFIAEQVSHMLCKHSLRPAYCEVNAALSRCDLSTNRQVTNLAQHPSDQHFYTSRAKPVEALQMQPNLTHMPNKAHCWSLTAVVSSDAGCLGHTHVNRRDCCIACI